MVLVAPAAKLRVLDNTRLKAALVLVVQQIGEGLQRDRSRDRFGLRVFGFATRLALLFAAPAHDGFADQL